jgi:phosphocarrier protein FPr
VADEAAAALAGKQAHFGAPLQTTPDSTEVGPSPTFTVTNVHGLHARPAARLVSAAKDLDAHIEIRNRTTGSPC